MVASNVSDAFGLVGLSLDHKYSIDSVVAAGGFGVVYRGRHLVLGTQVAVKVLKIPSSLSETARAEFIQNFVREAQIIAHVRHDAIVRVLDFGATYVADGTQAPWMVLDWIDGETLADDLAKRRGAGGRTPAECLELLRPVFEALAVAHEQGIAHRDLKPGNLMLQTPEANFRGSRHLRAARRMRLLDFGIAKVMEGDDAPVSGQTRTGSTFASFSPRYASPEQAAGTRTGPWTDVHALGLILTEMLVDAAPYTATEKMELLAQVIGASRPTPARFGRDVGTWEPIIARALSLRPADRHASAAELLEALENALPNTARLHAPVSTPPNEPVAAQLTAPSVKAELTAVEPAPRLAAHAAPVLAPAASAVIEPPSPTLSPRVDVVEPTGKPRSAVRWLVLALLLVTCAATVGVLVTNKSSAPSGGASPPPIVATPARAGAASAPSHPSTAPLATPLPTPDPTAVTAIATPVAAAPAPTTRLPNDEHALRNISRRWRTLNERQREAAINARTRARSATATQTVTQPQQHAPPPPLTAPVRGADRSNDSRDILQK